MPVFPEIGYKVTAKVIAMEKQCTIGMKPGEEYELSSHHCGNFCGAFYHSVYNWITMLQFGGTFPAGDPDIIEWCCPNSKKRVKVQFIREKK